METTQLINPYESNPYKRKLSTAIGIYVIIFSGMFLGVGNSIFLPMAGADIGGMEIYPLAQSIGGPVSVALMPIFGYISARSPHVRRTGLVIGFLVVIACMVVRATATNMWMIIFTALFLGIESAMRYTFGYALIRESFGQKQAGIYLGIVAAMFSAGSLAGPVIVAAVAQFLSWRFVPVLIAIGFAIGLLLVLAGVRITKEEGKAIATATSKVDLFGAISLAICLAGLILGLSLGNNYARFGTPLNTAFFVIAAVMFILLILNVRKKGDAAVIPSSVFKNRNAVMLTVINAMGPFTSMCMNFFLPAYIMTVLLLSPVESSLTLAMYSVIGLFFGPIFGRWVAKSGTCKPLSIWFSGVWRIAITIVLIIILVPGQSIFAIGVVMFIAGFYGSAAGVIGSTGPQIMIEPQFRQQGNAFIQLGQNLGSAVGVAIYTAIIAAFGMTEGITYALMVSLGGAVLMTICAILMKKPTWQEEEAKEAK